MTLLVEEEFVNRTKNYCWEGSGVYEPFTDDLGQLYWAYVKEYGRCTGKVYVDTKDGTKAVGWVFIKRQKYTDCDETFLQETWVTLHECRPDTTVTHHYKYIG